MKTGYRPEIDGLRAIAVLSVVIYHAGFVVGSVRLLPGGFLGVDVFFVISGYLITGILMSEERPGWTALLDFYERRARRILPALFLVIAACLPFAWWLMTPPQMSNFSGSAVSTALSVSNFFFWQDAGYFSEAFDLKPLAHSWSLAVEEQFYLFFPVLLLLLRKHFSSKSILLLFALGFLFSLGLANWMSGQDSAASFYLLPSRAWELLAGAMLSVVEANRRRPSSGPVAAGISVAAIITLALSFSLVNSEFIHPGLATVPLVLATMALIWFGGAVGTANRALTCRPIVAIGLISYSLYLWHQPVLTFARLYSINDLTQSQRVALVGLAFALSWLSWRFVERPFRAKDTVSTAAVWSAAGFAAAATVLFGTLGLSNVGWPQRMPPEYQRLASIGRGYWNLAGQDCLRQHCIVGNGPDVRIAVTGDSHSGMLAMSFDRALQGSDRAAWMLADGDIYVSAYPASYTTNAEGLNRILEQNKAIILAPEIDTVIYSARAVARISNLIFDNGEGGVERNPTPFNGRTDEAKAEIKLAIRDGIRELLDAGKRVVLIYPVPEVGWHTPDTLAKLFAQGLPAFTTSEDRYRERSADVFELYDGIGDAPGLLRIYPENLFCSIHQSGRCSVFDNGQVLYLDAQHLSVAGADRLVAEILQRANERWGGL